MSYVNALKKRRKKLNATTTTHRGATEYGKIPHSVGPIGPDRKTWRGYLKGDGQVKMARHNPGSVKHGYASPAEQE